MKMTKILMVIAIMFGVSAFAGPLDNMSTEEVAELYTEALNFQLSKTPESAKKTKLVFGTSATRKKELVTINMSINSEMAQWIAISKGVSFDQFKRKMIRDSKTVVNKMCNNKGIREYLDKGVKVKFHYTFSQSKDSFDVDVSKEICEKTM